MLGIFLFIAVVTAIHGSCPLNTVESTLYNSCYLFSQYVSRKPKDNDLSARVRWSAAEEVCNLYGGHLLSIRSKEHETYITTTFLSDKKDNAWIGANYFSGTWKWSDGKSFSYNDFKKNVKPTNGSVGIFANNFPLPVTWQIMNDDDATIAAFICEMPRCKNGQSADPLIKPDDKNTHIFYANIAQKWYVSSTSVYEEAQVLESEKKCALMLSHLPSIANDDENAEYFNWVSKMAPRLTYMPIGYIVTMGTWVWTDMNPSNYTSWASGQPQKMQQDLITLVNIKTGRWYSQQNADSNNEYVCAFPLNKNYCDGS